MLKQRKIYSFAIAGNLQKEMERDEKKGKVNCEKKRTHRTVISWVFADWTIWTWPNKSFVGVSCVYKIVIPKRT